jgi:rubrerythrin
MVYLALEKILNGFAEKEGKEHVDTYNKVALTAKAEGYADVEAMLCAYAEEEAKIAQTAKNVSELLKVKALLSEFAEKEGKEHVDTYNKVALTAKAEGYADVEAMLCAYAEEEAKIAQTAKNVAA